MPNYFLNYILQIFRLFLLPFLPNAASFLILLFVFLICICALYIFIFAFKNIIQVTSQDVTWIFIFFLYLSLNRIS